jgi:hypothetical protein
MRVAPKRAKNAVAFIFRFSFFSFDYAPMPAFAAFLIYFDFRWLRYAFRAFTR